ncbi:DUF3461 family protein [Amphritea balenae]|nr:DUF3461 family protein [Amphritea balenae]GGK72486.1 hypothetical protein GCM10007941_23180 [Amphritea balenae]
MAEYTTLQAMGITDINNISHYKLSQKENTEELKVYFKRPEGSTLPNSSSFSFEINKVVAADNEALAQNTKGSDPVLIAAIGELNSLSKQQSKGDRRNILMQEIDRMEQVMSAKIQELRDDLARI